MHRGLEIFCRSVEHRARHSKPYTRGMSPLPNLYKRLHDAPGDQSQRPTDPNGLVLEAWAEGYMIGSLIIMTCITIANMRRGVLLHKLILIEVRSPVSHCVESSRLTVNTVNIWLLARVFHFIQSTHLRLVAFSSCHTFERFLVASQCYCLDEAATFSIKNSQ